MADSPAMKKLHKLVATSAIYNGQRDDEDYTGVCHPGTREDQLKDLMDWAGNAPLDERVVWVNAVVGAGKTAMLRTFCTQLEKNGSYHPPTFFVWKSDTSRNTLKHFPPTIAAQLVRGIPALAPYVEKAINQDPFLLQSNFETQMDKLVISPLLDACDVVKQERHLVIIVDGLDELDPKSLEEFLLFIPSFLSRLSSQNLPISLLVSSRPDTNIVGAFERLDLAKITRPTRLGASDADIWKYLNDQFDDINIRFPYLQHVYGDKWPSHAKRAIMVEQSSGLFIWPTVAIDYIKAMGQSKRHNDRLETVLSAESIEPWNASPLDKLYKAILNAHAPKDRNSAEFLQFKRRIALLCLPVSFRAFVNQSLLRRHYSTHLPRTDMCVTPVRIVFEETLDEVWDSVADLSSIFLPRNAHSTTGKPTTPPISHLSFRDFAFNPARCGDLYYSSDKELRAEVVCKFIKYFETGKAYQGDIEMGTGYIFCVNYFLERIITESPTGPALENLGRFMDNVTLDSIPLSLPLLIQVCLVGQLFNPLYTLAEHSEFPDGLRRREAMLSTVTGFLQSRVPAEKWELALLRLGFKDYQFCPCHSVHCWQIARSSQCTCLHVSTRFHGFSKLRGLVVHNPLTWNFVESLAIGKEVDVARDYLEVLRYFLSLSETSPRAIELSVWVPTRLDHCICTLLPHCPPDEDLYNTLGPICTASLPDLPIREEDDSCNLVKQFLEQTKVFNTYTKECRASGIQTIFPPITIPDSWWLDEKTEHVLRRFGYSQPDLVDDVEQVRPSAIGKPDSDNFSSIEQRVDEDGGYSVDAGGTATVVATESPYIPSAASRPGVSAADSQRLLVHAEAEESAALFATPAVPPTTPGDYAENGPGMIGPLPDDVHHRRRDSARRVVKKLAFWR